MFVYYRKQLPEKLIMTATKLKQGETVALALLTKRNLKAINTFRKRARFGKGALVSAFNGISVLDLRDVPTRTSSSFNVGVSDEGVEMVSGNEKEILQLIIPKAERELEGAIAKYNAAIRDEEEAATRYRRINAKVQTAIKQCKSALGKR